MSSINKQQRGAVYVGATNAMTARLSWLHECCPREDKDYILDL